MSPGMATDSPLRVLYVEDDRVTALLFSQALLAETRIELRVAEDGAEALALVQEWRPEVLVLDAHLPDLHGDALLGQLRALPDLGRVPAYMCSADGEPEDLQRAQTAGFDGYWVKPVSPRVVLQALLALWQQRLSPG